MLATGSYPEQWKVVGVEDAGWEGLKCAYLLIQGCDTRGTMENIRVPVVSKTKVVPAFLELIIQRTIWGALG